MFGEPSVILKYKKNYDEVLRILKPREEFPYLLDEEKNYLTFLSSFFTPAKRVHEMVFLNECLRSGRITAAFGEEITSKVEINDNYTVEKEKHINVVVEAEKTQAKGIQINRGNQKVKVENKGSINVQGKKYYAKGIHAYNDAEIINDGSIMITGKADVQGIQGENNINVTVKNGENAKITTSGTGKVFGFF